MPDYNQQRTDVDLVDEIYRMKVQRRLPWREIHRLLDTDLSVSALRQKYLRAYPRVTDQERAQQRELENEKLDDLEAHWMSLYLRNVPNAAREDNPAGDEDYVVKALRGMNTVHKSRVTLNGLAEPKVVKIERDDDGIQAEIDLLLAEEAAKKRAEEDVIL